MWGMSRQKYQELLSETERRRAAVRSQLHASAYRVTLAGAQHMSFSDVPLLERSRTAMAPERSIQIVRSYLLAFFDRYLKGSPAPLLQGGAMPFPEVTFVEYGPAQ